MCSKKKFSYFVLASFFFLSGVEYAVILPTMWLYIHNRFNAQEYFLGFMLSAFSVSDLICSPIYGRISDKTRRIKIIIFVSNLWEIGGNIMYAMGISKGFLLASRFVAGCGAGAGAAVVAEIARTTTSAERTGSIALLMACRQLGLVIGPACNLFLREFNFFIGPFKIDSYTAPGLFMAIVWIIHQVIVLSCYTDLNKFEDTLTIENNSCEVKQGNSVIIINRSITYNGKYFVNEFLRDEIVAILASVFAGLFNQTALETLVTPLTEKYMGWGELENSLMYGLAGVEVIAVFFVVRALSRCYTDRTLLIVGTIFSIGALVWLLCFFPRATPNHWSNLPIFIVGVFTDVLSLPFLAVCSVSLYSKLTCKEGQGLAQGIRRSVMNLGTIIGPLWAGALFTNLYVLLGVIVGLLCLILILLLLSYKRLNDAVLSSTIDSESCSSDHGDKSVVTERSALLVNS